MTEADDLAFPLIGRTMRDMPDGRTRQEWYCDLGLTKREYYAGLAMQAIMSKSTEDLYNHFSQGEKSIDLQISECAVAAADSLIESLNKEEHPK